MNPHTPVHSKPDRSRLIIGILLATVLAGGAVSFLSAGGKSHRPMVKKTDIVTITLPPPPLPPPPPPPPPLQTKQPEMVEQQPVDQIEEPSETPMENPSDEALATNITGNGPDMGLRAGSGGAGGNRNKIGTGRRAGKWDHYAVTVQNTIAETLRRTSGVRSAAFTLKVRVWADANGRITRANLMETSGNTTVDQSIKNQVLTGLQLPEPPPADMPMPINMRISARNPNLTMR